MLMLFDESVQWRILSFFFLQPQKAAYVNEISKASGCSKSAVSNGCKKLKHEGILKLEKKANAVFYSLENSSPFVKRLKSAWFLGKLAKWDKILEGAEFQSVALYGSRASGEFIEESDIDVLVLANVAQARVEEIFAPLQKEEKGNISLTVLSISKWAEMARRKDRFYMEVVANHVQLFGSPILVG